MFLNHPTPSLSEPWGSYLIRLNKGGRGMRVQQKRRLAKRYLVTAVLWPQRVVKPEAKCCQLFHQYCSIGSSHFYILRDSFGKGSHFTLHQWTISTDVFTTQPPTRETSGIFKQRYRTCQDTKKWSTITISPPSHQFKYQARQYS